MIYVIADTNALLMPFENHFNLDCELQRLLGNYTIAIPKPILGELERLKPGNRWAKAALDLARSRECRPTDSDGDDAVLELATALDGIVLTNDIELIERCRSRSVRVIRMREGSRLAFDGDI